MTTNIVNVYDPQQFGVGDGATTQFQIGGPREVVTSMTPTGVWRQDWQGNQRLFPIPRTNLIFPSNNFASVQWFKAASTIVSEQLGPSETVSSSMLMEDTSTAIHRIRYLYAFSADATYSTTFYIKAAGRIAISLIFYDGPNNYAVFDLNLQTGEVVQGRTFIPATCTADDMGDGWWRVSSIVSATLSLAGTYIDIRMAATWPPPTNNGNNPYTGDGVSGVFIAATQLELSDRPGSYIPTFDRESSLTDYTVSSTGLVSMGQVPAIGASLTWTGSYTYEYQDDAPTLADRTVISQYANSPTLRQLIRNMDEYIDPAVDFDAFYDYVWNVETAQGFGLDIWGRIVGVGRMLTIPGAGTYLGYSEAYTAPTAATGAQPFGQAPMYTGATTSQTYRLADDAYRKLILVKALANISDCTSPSLNRLLSNLFAGRGRCYVTDTGKMEFRYVFEFALELYEIAILTQSGAIPKPAAVLASVLQVDVPSTFGFNEAAMQPFGSGVFFTSSGLINASQ